MDADFLMALPCEQSDGRGERISARDKNLSVSYKIAGFFRNEASIVHGNVMLFQSVFSL